MTVEQWQKLRKKPIGPEISVLPEPETLKMGPEKVTLPETAIQPTDTEEDNPFTLSSDDASAVETVQLMIDSDPKRLPMTAQNESPRSYAVLYSKAYWMEQHGATERANLRRKIGDNLLMFGVSKKGKDNRAAKVLDALKFINQQEFELEKSTGKKLMGK